jgi:hypothetical protein
MMLAGCGSAGAGDDYFGEDLWGPYTNRHDKATPTSGNAHDANSVTQFITPWPPYVADRRIPGDGARMVGAIKRYRNPRGQEGDSSGTSKVTTRSEVTVQGPANQLPGLIQGMGQSGKSEGQR